jgi:GNAT superfamily N-acetyltransferase
MVRVRRGESRDLPAVHRLVGELAIYEKAEREFTASLQDYYRDFEKGVFHILVAEESEQVIGMALYYLAYSTWKGKMLYLEDFVVQEAQRRRGVGQMLFDALAEEAKQMGCRLLKWQVLDWNSPAIAFYEKQSATIEQGWWNGKIFLSNPLA